MKNNKYLNSKVSVLMLSVYLFMGSVEILKAPPVTEGKAPDTTSGREDTASGEHTGTYTGEPPVGARPESKPTESGSSHETSSESGTGSKTSGKQEGVHLDEEAAPSEEISAKNDVAEVSKEEAAPKEEAPAPEVKTAKMPTSEMATRLINDANDARTPDDIKEIIKKIDKMDNPTSVSEEQATQLDMTLKSKINEMSEDLNSQMDKNNQSIKKIEQTMAEMLNSAKKWMVTKDGDVVNPSLFTQWVDVIRSILTPNAFRMETIQTNAKSTMTLVESNKQLKAHNDSMMADLQKMKL